MAALISFSVLSLPQETNSDFLCNINETTRWTVKCTDSKNREIIHIYNIYIYIYICMFVCIHCGGTAEPVAHNNPNPANWMTSRSSLFFSSIVFLPPRIRFLHLLI